MQPSPHARRVDPEFPSGRSRQPLPAAALVAGLLVAALTGCLPTGPGTERISVDPDGQQVPVSSHSAAMSRDGRFVVFTSGARPGSQEPSQIFRKDRATGAVAWVSRSDGGAALPGSNVDASISADGTKVAFTNVTFPSGEPYPVVYVRDLTAGRTFPVSVSGATGAPVSGTDPDISSDGRYVAFVSDATSIVSNDTNGASDVFVRDLAAEVNRRVSLTNSGFQIFGGADGAAISNDGRHVAFRTGANLEGADTDSDPDIYVRDTVTGTTTFESIAGANTNPSPYFDISDDGRRVAFVSSEGTRNPQGWVRDRSTGVLHFISGDTHNGPIPDEGVASEISISRDGEHVALTWSSSPGLPKTDIYVATSEGEGVTRMSTNDAGDRGFNHSFRPQVADGGLVVAFDTSSRNIVEGDTNDEYDVFVKRR